MNIVVHMTPCSPTSTVASARIARFVQETLPDFLLVHTREHAIAVAKERKSIDNLVICNGPMAFCPFLKELGQMVTDAHNVIWLQQDYSILPPSQKSSAESPFRKAFAEKNLRPIYWTTIKKNVITSNDKYINWNQLTYDPQPVPRLSELPTLFYYGAFREKRVASFNKWLADSPYHTLVSTTTLRGKKFKELDPAIEIVPPFTSLGNLPTCSAALYIEDEKSHKEFHSPANRFYEMLSAGIPMFFDAASVPMLAQAGIHPQPNWIVNSAGQLYTLMQELDLQNMQNEQREMWHADYRLGLKEQLQMIWEDHTRLN
jgi:hypothetical protein